MPRPATGRSTSARSVAEVRIPLMLRLRAWRLGRAQRRRDREWLATNPSLAEIQAEVNRRRLEFARYQVSRLGDDV
jgi:hypothetical protein